jgi:phage terminase large subunit-like protein
MILPKALSIRQLHNTIAYTEDIINNLSDKALNELMEGYDGDVENLFDQLLIQTSNVINQNGASIDSEKLEFLSNLEKSFDEQLKRVSYNYFKTTVLPNFHQGWRNLEWGNMIQLYSYIAILASRSHGKSYESCYAYPLWRMYTYNKPNFYDVDTVDNKNRKETLLITNTSTLGSEHFDKVVEEIKFNDLLGDKLNSGNKASLGSTGITTETGAKLHLRGIGGFFRGLHCGSVVGDDMLDESSIYSQEQRDKLKSKFYGGITPIVEPYGNCLITGTPFSERDLYYDLKNDERFVVLEYPAIFPDGRLLSPDRFTFEKLTEEKKSLGTLVFSREYLVVPVSDDATIFPFEILMRSTVGMENISLVDNIDSYPIKLRRVVIGCDFAKSANVGADYTVYTVWGSDSMDNYYLLHIYRKRGASHNEQISQIVSLDQRFKPNLIICESNGFQGMLSDMARERGIKNIQEFTTTSLNKKNWYDGLPSLAALWERGQIKIPYKSGITKETADLLFQEFNSISFRPDKGTLESVGGKDDQAMSCFFAITDLRENKNVFKAYMA